MGLNFYSIKETIDKVDDKIPDDVKKKAKELATKENLEKAKDAVTDFFSKKKDDDKKDEDK